MRFEIKNYTDFKDAVERLCGFLSEREISEEKVFDSRLIAHELLSNVLQHSGGSAWLQEEILDSVLHLDVRAERVFQPPTEGSCPECFAERGRGLYLVDALSAERTFTEEGEILVKIRIR